MDERQLENDKFLRTLALIWTVFSICYISAISFIEIPLSSVRFVDTIIGFLLGTIISAIIQFFYGSSIGSKEKSQKLEEQAELKKLEDEEKLNDNS